MLIFLVGMMGSGKSTVGRLLAKKLSMPYFDTDLMISKDQNQTISEIFESKGEIFFRELEKKLITHLKINQGVIATGGGLPCHNELMEILNDKGITIYIEAGANVILERIKEDQTRPLFKGKTKDEMLEYLHTTISHRKQFYGLADITAKSIGSPEMVAENILSKI